MSIATLGTAVAGLSKGYMEGSRFRSEMEDAEQMRKKRGIEMEAAELQLGESKARAKAFQQSREVVQKYMPLISGEGEVAPEGATVPEGGEPAPRAGGITPPGGAPAPAAPRMSKWDAMQKMYTELNMIGLNSGTIPYDKALETAIGMSKKFGDAKTDSAIRALQSFDGSNQAQVEGALAQAGLVMPQGTAFVRKKTEVFPNSGIMVDDVVATSPDGSRSVSLNQLMRSRLDPKDWMNMNNEVGYRAAELGFRRQSEENLRSFQDRQLTAQIEHWKALEDQHKKQTEISLRRLGLDEDKYGFERLQNGLSKAYGQAMDMVGFVKMNEEKLANLSSDERQDYARKLMQGTVIYSVYEQNFDLRGKKPNITMSEAASAARFAAANRDKIETDSTGQAFVEIGGKKIFVPRPQAPAQQQQPQRPGVAPQAAAPVTQQPGVQTPPPPSVADTQANFRRVQEFLAGAKAAADRDQEVAALKAQQQQALRSGKAVEANNIMAQIRSILAERYNITPLGGVADPSKINPQQ